MLPHSGGKSLKYNIIIRQISIPTAIAAYSTETINVIINELIMPNRAVCHVKYLNVGLDLKIFHSNYFKIKYLIKKITENLVR